MNFKNQFVSAFAECVLNIGFSLSLFNASSKASGSVFPSIKTGVSAKAILSA